MTPEMKQQWTEALESGEYEQGQGMLYDGNAYCCLGVLCAVAGIVFKGGQGYLNDVQMETFGLSKDQCRALASLNDGFASADDHMARIGLESPPIGYSDVSGAPFPVIAKLIREQF